MIAFASWIDSPDRPEPGSRPNSLRRSRKKSDEESFWGIVWSNRWYLILLNVIVFLLYLPVASFEFLNWEDPWYVVHNDLIRAWTPSNIYALLTEHVAQNFVPLTMATFLFDYTLWGSSPGGYHITNVLIHGLNCVLVYALLRRLTQHQWMPWIVTALFAVHPIQVETVAWISSRKILLSSTFILASLNCWLRPQRTHAHACWGTLWMVCGVLSQAAATVILPIVILYDVWISKRSLLDSFKTQIVPLLIWISLVYFTKNPASRLVSVLQTGEQGLLMVLLADFLLLWKFALTLVWPLHLGTLYDQQVRETEIQILFSVIASLLLIGFVVQEHKRHPLATFVAATWLLLFMAMFLLSQRSPLVNGRGAYLACVPMLSLLCGLIQWVWNRTGYHFQLGREWTTTTAGVAFLLVLGTMVWKTTLFLPVYQDAVSLWEHASQTTPANPVVHIQLAMTLEEKGRTQEAITTLEYALENCDPVLMDRDLIVRILERLQRTSSVAESHETI